MSKHPGPWTITDSGYMLDANGTGIAHVYTDDPETRAVLLHAAEMWEALRLLHEHAVDEERNEYEGSRGMLRDCPAPISSAGDLLTKIESEIAKARKPEAKP